MPGARAHAGARRAGGATLTSRRTRFRSERSQAPDAASALTGLLLGACCAGPRGLHAGPRPPPRGALRRSGGRRRCGRRFARAGARRTRTRLPRRRAAPPWCYERAVRCARRSGGGGSDTTSRWPAAPARRGALVAGLAGSWSRWLPSGTIRRSFDFTKICSVGMVCRVFCSSSPTRSITTAGLVVSKRNSFKKRGSPHDPFTEHVQFPSLLVKATGAGHADPCCGCGIRLSTTAVKDSRLVSLISSPSWRYLWNVRIVGVPSTSWYRARSLHPGAFVSTE